MNSEMTYSVLAKSPPTFVHSFVADVAVVAVESVVAVRVFDEAEPPTVRT
jgi:hypothetical protein